MPTPASSAEPIAVVVLGVVVLALLVVGLGFWVWQGTSVPADYSELFWGSAPHVDDDTIAFAIRLRSHESQDLRWDVNAYLGRQEVSRKKIQLVPGQEKQVDFSIPLSSGLIGDHEVRIVAQRFDGLGNAVKQPLEIRDWVHVPDANAESN
ncbi:MAG: hypothetical protein IPJ89_04975 [Candidatus Iainarchaeum archaeon]|uniref:DUF1616 domain-containing protein n=1 Tax=Candidatus Iainarchaeum sp. TaxID=3101447 RepID=A0A7T9DJH5_9ARCH|nr:MAG: hypothetical protein IPJ89_04975 [Candidatus Diapherotrites archaeon]